MTEYATLTIQKKLSRKRDPIYQAIYDGKKNGDNMDNVFRKEKRDLNGFGSIRFIEHFTGVYYEHVPESKADQERTQLLFENDIANDWLLCFSYDEMEVIGLDMGVFQAEASVEEVLERLEWSDISMNSKYYEKRNALLRWLKANALREDRIMICSQWVFYHEEGKYDYDWVRNNINKRISEMRQEVTCPHWKKGKIDRPKQMVASMTA